MQKIDKIGEKLYIKSKKKKKLGVLLKYCGKNCEKIEQKVKQKIAKNGAKNYVLINFTKKLINATVIPIRFTT